MQNLCQRDIKYLPGVGPKRAEWLEKELNIRTFADLLYYFPYKYADRTRFYKISEIHPDLPHVQIRGRFTWFGFAGDPRRKRFVARFADETGSVEVIWFRGLRWIQNAYQTDREYVLFGKPTVFNRQINLVHPEVEEASAYDKSLTRALQPFYSTTEKLKNNFISSKTIQKLMNNLFEQIGPNIQETLPSYLLEETGLMPLPEALLNIHFPESPRLLSRARYRLKFEELFLIQLSLLQSRKIRTRKTEGFVFSRVGDSLNEFYENHLPFELTKAQKRVIREIRKDMGSGRQMNRLLQGDVGSGKTLVALMSMLIARDNGYQSCLMAPTEILAAQHYRTLKNFLGNMNVQVDLLTGSTRKKDRETIQEDLVSGKTDILVGTHALIEETVRFSRLGLAVIDEQHRFGVAQRASLWKKNERPPHVLVMTATPIPRTLAMTLYGDLDISVIDELPPGRKPVKTLHYYDSQRLRMFGFLKKQIAEGRQVYVVYPLISESEKMDYKDLEDGYESICRAFPPPDYAVSVVHGRMKPAEKDKAMNHFIAGRTHIMVATTVIEVGVDVPNASVMVIESAERFGLSQLHQLRGRVGRGADQSYCIMMTSFELSREARMRIETMVRTNDGFEIAEADLKLRGPGNLEGTQQSGIPFTLRIADLGKDGQLLQYARDTAEKILAADPELNSPENRMLLETLRRNQKEYMNWSMIS
ncbi:MAG: ATP-dependent DNA helicase RecG [Bacteroidales bacterium]